MSKTYYCSNIIDSVECGENVPEKFSPGRYNKCRNCRNLLVKNHQKKLKEEYDKKKEKKEENLEIKCNCDEKFASIEQKIEELQKEIELLKTKL
jgi:hypothetical protein